MRILHFADLHIGVENYGRPATQADLEALQLRGQDSPPFDRLRARGTEPRSATPASPGQPARGEPVEPPSGPPDSRPLAAATYLGLSTRLLDFLATYDQVVEYALREHVDLVLFSGDAYKSRDPSQTHQREFARRIATLVGHGIPVFLVVGNHDLPSAPGRATALEIFPTLSVAKVTVADRLGRYLVETPSGPLQVLAVPWVRRGALLSREEHRGKSIQELTRYVEEELARRLRQEAEGLDPTIPTVVAAHLTVAGSVTSSERSMMLGHDHVLNPSDLALPGVDYVALGHVHKHQVLKQNPPMVYSGSLQRVDFSEEADTKGFCLVELDPARPPGARASWEFIPVKARPFLTINVELSPGDADPTEAVLRAVARHAIAGAVVRLRVKLPAELEGRLSDRAIGQALSTAHYVAGIEREVLRERRTRLGGAVQGLTPEQALERYLESREGLDPETKRRALERGRELIGQELAQQ